MTDTDINRDRYEYVIKYIPFENNHSWHGLITVCFSYAISWAILWVTTTSYLQSVTIHLSDVYDPFPDILCWLANICSGNQISEVRIDEEGTEKILKVERLDGNILDFMVLDGFEPEKILLRSFVNERQLVEEFIIKLELFFKSYMQEEYWEGTVFAEDKTPVITQYLGNKVSMDNIHRYISHDFDDE